MQSGSRLGSGSTINDAQCRSLMVRQARIDPLREFLIFCSAMKEILLEKDLPKKMLVQPQIVTVTYILLASTSSLAF